MKKIYFSSLLFATILASQPAKAQDGPPLRLRVGNVTLPKNAELYQQQKSQLAKALYAGHFHVVLQFDQLPTATQRQAMTVAGIKLLDYLPDNSYFALLPENLAGELSRFGVRSVAELGARHKVEPSILAGNFPSHAVRPGRMLEVEVLLVSDYWFADFSAKFIPLRVELVSESPQFRTVRLRIPQGQLATLAEMPFVQWIEAVAPPNQTENLPGKTMHRSAPLEFGSRALTGLGVRLGIWDGGQAGPHLDFTGRMTVVQNVSSDQHATHVAGTVSGAGVINPSARGMATKVSVYSYDFSGDVPSEMGSAIANYGIVLTQNSYGSGSPFCTSSTEGGDAYDLTERNRDLLINNNPSLLHVFSSGNSGTLCGGFRNITNKADKNNLVCANLQQDGVTMNTGSSRGPVLDGRLKPEISGIGTSVLSTTPNNQYGTLSGTSMATPGVSGTLSQLYEYYKRRNEGNNPPSALMKAIACNTADDILNPGPDYVAGFGRINGLRAAKVIETNQFTVNSLTNGQTRDITLAVPAGTSEIKVMLAWNDPAAAANANPALVNNLNLQVIDPANNVFNPWVLNPAAPANAATRGVDNIDNKEQVTISTPVAGNYTLRVSGATVTTPTQQYALTWEVNPTFVEVAYPAGNEFVTSGTTVRIVWNATGVSGNQTVEYSADGGESWSVLSSTVPATARSFDWVVPANQLPTSLALIRVSQGSATDVSDANFTLAGVPSNLTLTGTTCGGATLTWGDVEGASGYDVLKFNPATNDWAVVASNIATNNTTVSGLGLSNWLAVRARNNAAGWVGQRSIATEVNTPNDLAIQPRIFTAQSLNFCTGTITLSAKGVPHSSYVITSVPHTARDASSDIPVPLGNDEVSGALPINFPFSFYGLTYESFYISSNGYIGFSPQAMTTATAQSLPNPENPNNLIALCWTNLDPSIAGGSIRYQTIGSAPNRRLVVSFVNVAEANAASNRFTGRIELSEGSNEIRLFTDSKNFSTSATQGMENVDGGAFSVLAPRNNTEWLANTPDAYRYEPAPVEVVWSNGASAASISVGPTPTSYSFSYALNGCTYTSPSVSITNPTLAISPNSLPNGQVGTAYSQSLTTTGGSGGYTYTRTAGTLPTGLSLTTNGTLAGTPSAANTFNFTITATDGQGCTVNKAYTITVSTVNNSCPLTPTGLAGTSWDAATRVLTKTAANGWNNATARSAEVLPANTDGWVEWEIPAITSTFYMAGLADAASAGNWANVDYGIYFAVGQIYVYTAATGILFTGRNAAAGDKLRVWKRGDRVNFYHNGTALMPFYEYPANPATPLFFDVSFFSNGASLRNPVSSFCQSLPNAPCNLAWANTAGATFNAANNTLTKTAATGWGNAGATSAVSLPANTDGGISWTIPTGPLDQTFYMLGLSQSSPDNSWASVQYGLYYAGGQVYVYLSGANQGFYGNVQPGDKLSILRTGNAVNFYRNNKSFFGTAAPANVPLVADLAMFSSGARVQGLQGHNMCTGPRPLAARAEEAPAQGFDAPGLAVYPNPTTGQFTVALGNLGRAELSVLDVLGREVLRQTAEGPLATLDLSGQPAGTYLVRVRAEGYVRTVKVVKE
jgi:hypothetical protein